MTYADITNRSWALDTPQAAMLFSSLPQNLCEKLKHAFLTAEIKTEEMDSIRTYLAGHSEISRIISEKPGSALAFEYLYRLKDAASAIDCYFLQATAGRHVEGRLRALETYLPSLIKPLIDDRTVLVDNIGSGPGHDMIRVLNNNPALAAKVHVRNIDPDEDALVIGIREVSTLNLSDSFSFVCREFQRVKPRHADIVLLIGILCPLPMKICEKIIRILKRYARPDGLIIFSTNQVGMLIHDPLTDFLMRLAGWEMDYKTDMEAASIAERAGWRFVSQFFDDEDHFQCMTVAQNRT